MEYKNEKTQYFSKETALTAIINMLTSREQELSYRKQISRNLRTQYLEGIYDNPVTLKSRLRVTQGH